jgi:hypothetical protein
MNEIYRSLEQLWREMYQMTGDREHRDKMLYWGKRADDKERAQRIKETR